MNTAYHLKSDYDYCFADIFDKEWLLIRDLNLGRMSVTNNIENIVQYLFNRYEIQNNMPVAYRDSDGEWIGWMQYEKVFVFFEYKDTMFLRKLDYAI